MLLGERDALNMQFAALRTSRDSLQRRSRLRQPWQLSDNVIRVLMLCYITSGYALEPPIKYLSWYASICRWPPKGTEELAALVEATFLSAGVSMLASLDDPICSEHDAAAKTASKYVEQWRLKQWVVDQNIECGVAPSTDAVLTQLHIDLEALDEHRRPPPVGNIMDVSARMWVHRWRIQWGGRYGSLPTTENSSMPDLRIRASRIPLHSFNVELSFVERVIIPRSQPLQTYFNTKCKRILCKKPDAAILFHDTGAMIWHTKRSGVIC